MRETPRDALPALTPHEMREVDRLMVDTLGIDLARMMEHAGRHLARLTAQLFLGGDPSGHTVTVLAGRGGNGGGALVAARRLHGWGAAVQVVLARPGDELASVPRQQLTVLERLGVPIDAVGVPATGADVVLDGVIGYSLNGAPMGRAGALIRWAGGQEAPVVSLDLPSGLDATTGERPGDVVPAAATLSLALPKRGLLVPEAQHLVGGLYLCDIGVPPEVYGELGVDVGPIFSGSEILHLV